MSQFVRQLLTALRALVILTVLLGIAYPAFIWGVGQIAFPRQADGSLVVRNGTVVGSRSIGQTFKGKDWFISRPSAGDYDALASAGTNLGPSDGDLVAEIKKRRKGIAQRDDVPEADVPPDAVTASASGLDPFISPAYAAIQERRVAQARGLSPAQVHGLVAAQTQGRILGFLGQPRVNVLELNLALAATG